MRPLGVATALYGWTERYQRDGVVWDWDLLYRECAETGVDAVETDLDDDRLRLLRSYDLRVSASYVGLPLVLPFDELDVERVVVPVAERLAAAGGTDLLLNADAVDWSVPVEKSVADAERQGENLSRIAARVADLGLRVSLHNHASTFDDAQADLDSVVRYADDAVGLCIDTGWARAAGHDPVAWARGWPERVVYLHLRNHADGAPTEDLTVGEVAVPALLDAVPDYSGWLTLELWHPPVIEPARSMQEDTRRSVEYVRSLLVPS